MNAIFATPFTTPFSCVFPKSSKVGADLAQSLVLLHVQVDFEFRCTDTIISELTLQNVSRLFQLLYAQLILCSCIPFLILHNTNHWCWFHHRL